MHSLYWGLWGDLREKKGDFWMQRHPMAAPVFTYGTDSVGTRRRPGHNFHEKNIFFLFAGERGSGPAANNNETELDVEEHRTGAGG
jgi:hypothetical protein